LVCNELFFLDSPPVLAGNQLATPAVQYPAMIRPRSTLAGFVAIPAAPATAQSQGDSVNDMSAENVFEAREAREHVRRLIRSWIGDAKTVLKIVSPVQLILFCHADFV
jgi:hypothetical protein